MVMGVGVAEDLPPPPMPPSRSSSFASRSTTTRSHRSASSTSTRIQNDQAANAASLAVLVQQQQQQQQQQQLVSVFPVQAGEETAGGARSVRSNSTKSWATARTAVEGPGVGEEVGRKGEDEGEGVVGTFEVPVYRATSNPLQATVAPSPSVTNPPQPKEVTTGSASESEVLPPTMTGDVNPGESVSDLMASFGTLLQDRIRRNMSVMSTFSSSTPTTLLKEIASPTAEWLQTHPGHPSHHHPPVFSSSTPPSPTVDDDDAMVEVTMNDEEFLALLTASASSATHDELLAILQAAEDEEILAAIEASRLEVGGGVGGRLEGDGFEQEAEVVMGQVEIVETEGFGIPSFPPPSYDQVLGGEVAPSLVEGVKEEVGEGLYDGFDHPPSDSAIRDGRLPPVQDFEPPIQPPHNDDKDDDDVIEHSPPPSPTPSAYPASILNGYEGTSDTVPRAHRRVTAFSRASTVKSLRAWEEEVDVVVEEVVVEEGEVLEEEEEEVVVVVEGVGRRVTVPGTNSRFEFMDDEEEEEEDDVDDTDASTSSVITSPLLNHTPATSQQPLTLHQRRSLRANPQPQTQSSPSSSSSSPKHPPPVLPLPPLPLPSPPALNRTDSTSASSAFLNLNRG
ncbi:hypothetical protein HDU67_000166, partial [Dinochytrium kinnereticum]